MSATFVEFDHAPGANLDYGFDWSDWLEAGETLVDSDWEATEGIVLTQPQMTQTLTSIFAGGGDIEKFYSVTNTITTSLGKVDSRTLILVCKKR